MNETDLRYGPYEGDPDGLKELVGEMLSRLDDPTLWQTGEGERLRWMVVVELLTLTRSEKWRDV